VHLLKIFSILILLPLIFSNAKIASAKQRHIITDAEIQSYLEDLTKPLLKAAGISTSDVKLHILADASLNAFVSSGRKIFLNTGLLMNTVTPGQLRGVLAHEIGHIAGGHLIRTAEVARKASNVAMVSSILSATAIVLTGKGEAATALLGNGQNIARQVFLRHSRAQESAADNAAARYLRLTKQNPKGLLDFLKILKKNEAMSTVVQSPYFRTHPLTKDRIAFFENQIATRPNNASEYSSIMADRHKRMIAKLFGFLEPPSKTFKRYQKNMDSIVSKYAYAIAFHKNANTAEALSLLDELLSIGSKDPYFWELKGQVLFESAEPYEARVAYQKALNLGKHIPLIREQLARVELAIGTPNMNLSALKHSQISIQAMPTSTLSWHNLAIAQGRTGDVAMANLSLAEEALLQNRIKMVILYANRAQKLLQSNTPSYQRSKDIIELAQRISKRKK